jgi:transcription initiation factor IIE alpha subunit
MRIPITIYLCPDCFVPIDIKSENYYGSTSTKGKCLKCKRELHDFDCEKVTQNVED